MAPIARTQKRPSSSHALREAASWLALLTATTLTSRSDVVRAEVRATRGFDAVPEDQPHRLVVQVYPRRAVVGGRVQGWARPSASAQRAITRDELAAGIPVHLVDFGRLSVDTHDQSVVVAWVEGGAPDLDLDGIDARPRSGAPWAVAPLRPGTRDVKLRLGTRSAA